MSPWRRPAERDPRSPAALAADNELDPLGCFWLALRVAGCMTLLYTLMFLAIFLAGLVSRILS